jgi:hypothetical protein
MTARPAPPVEIDSVHSAAICKEVGQRLDLYFRKEISDTPPELKQLLLRLRELDRGDAPPVAPR